jgi:hypothetical protein
MQTESMVSTEETEKPEKPLVKNIGVNTSFEKESKTVKIVHDPFEENRLMKNIDFWKEKVD